MRTGVLTFFCGKMGSGKSTASKQIALKENAVLLSEDEWLEALYPNKIKSLEDYLKYSKRLKPQIKKLVQSILSSGTNVVLDFPGNTRQQRNWFKSIYSEIESNHRLIYIDLSDEMCLKQINKRRLQNPERAQTDTEEMFHQITKYFEAPQAEEGFNILNFDNVKLDL